MNRKTVGVMLLATAGVVIALGTVGAQIAFAIVRAGFFAERISGVTPIEPQNAFPHWLVVVVALSLAGGGVYFIKWPQKE